MHREIFFRLVQSFPKGDLSTLSLCSFSRDDKGMGFKEAGI
jgi:hypothetical protein